MLPSLQPWMKKLLVALLAIYVAELVLANASVDLGGLAWHSFGAGFGLWQPFTRLLVQGRSVSGVLGGMLTLYFFLPAVWQFATPQQMRDAAIAAFAGSCLAIAAADLIISAPGVVSGWPVLCVALVVLFGLFAPDLKVYLFFTLPVSGSLMVWGTLAGSVLYFLTNPSMFTAQGLGVWVGVYAWWRLLGPGARRRHLQNQAKDIERELRKFQLIEGGKGKGQGGQRDDEWIN